MGGVRGGVKGIVYGDSVAGGVYFYAEKPLDGPLVQRSELFRSCFQERKVL